MNWHGGGARLNDEPTPEAKPLESSVWGAIEVPQSESETSREKVANLGALPVWAKAASSNIIQEFAYSSGLTDDHLSDLMELVSLQLMNNSIDELAESSLESFIAKDLRDGVLAMDAVRIG